MFIVIINVKNERIDNVNTFVYFLTIFPQNISDS